MLTSERPFGALAEPAASVAELRRVGWLDVLDRDALQGCFILDELLELEVAPPTEHPVLTSSPSLLDAFQVFHADDCGVTVIHDVLAHVVIRPSDEPCLFAPSPLQEPFGAPSAFRLELSTEEIIAPFDATYPLAVNVLAVAEDGEAFYAEIDAENRLVKVQVLGSDLFSERESEECATALVEREKTFAQLPREVITIAGRDGEGEALPAVQESQVQGPIPELGTPGEVVPDAGPLDIGLRPSLLRYSACLLDARNRELCWQGLPQVLIDERMQPDIVLDALAPSNVDAVLQSFVECSDSGDYLVRGVNLDFGADLNLHAQEDTTTAYKCCAPPLFKKRGIRARRSS